MKKEYLVFDLFGTITSRRYLPAIFAWYLSSKKPQSNLIDSAFEMRIKRLSKRYKLYILSNANHRFVASSLKETELLSYFEEVLISSEIGARKPSAEAFKELAGVGVDPAKSIFIDDSKSNRAQAKKMGYSILEFNSKKELISKLSDL